MSVIRAEVEESELEKSCGVGAGSHGNWHPLTTSHYGDGAIDFKSSRRIRYLFICKEEIKVYFQNFLHQIFRSTETSFFCGQYMTIKKQHVKVPKNNSPQ